MDAHIILPTPNFTAPERIPARVACSRIVLCTAIVSGTVGSVNALPHVERS